MKTAILIIGLLLTTAGYSQTLKSAMKVMGTNLKLISIQVKDPSKNASSLALAEEFLRSSEESRGLIPDTAGTPDRKARYIEMIDQSSEQAKQLIDAFRNNDNQRAKLLVDGLLKSKKDGHNEFN